MQFGSLALVLGLLTRLLDLQLLLQAGGLELGVLRALLLVDLQLLHVQLHALLRLLGLHLQLLALEGQPRVLHRGLLRLELLEQLLGPRDDLGDALQLLRALLQRRVGGLGQHAVQRLLGVGVALVHLAHDLAQVLPAHAVGRHVEHRRRVPQGDVLLDVVQDRGDEDRREDRVGPEHRVQQVADVRLQVGDVVLLRERRDRPPQRRGDVLVDRVLLRRLERRVEQLLGLGDFQRLEDAFLDLAQVVQLRKGGGALGDCLNLRVALGLAEDVRVGDRHDV